MSERSELADILNRATYEDGLPTHDFDLLLCAADDILAAGYRKPRTIETAKDLFHSGLTEGSILLSVGDYYKGALWVVAGGMIARVGKERDGVCPPLLFKDPLPVTVLREGPAS